MGGQRAPQPEHPRVGGEDNRARFSGGTVSGTPPRRRGGRERGVLQGGVSRNTPASAGRTCSCAWCQRREAEHPRVGGEDTSPASTRDLTAGTPPRRRGGRRRRRVPPACPRNTPASAGRTPKPANASSSSTEHPRVGGEDAGTARSTAPSTGTPPRRRGGHPPEAGHRRPLRNTPASAGRTPKWPKRPGELPEHPRVGGEDLTKVVRVYLRDGTPPRRRGGHGRPDLVPVGRRNTPASAGRTLGLAAWIAVCTGTPPRRRGGRARAREPFLI